jgi:7-carboxy-7-deazaguanine synthase
MARTQDGRKRSAQRPDGLRISEIYRSIQGESTLAGWPCTFVRTAGCDIRCTWCDEPQALSGGSLHSVDQVLARVEALGVRLVEITGGEPLLQRAVPELVQRLLERGHEVACETGGHHDIALLDPRCRAIVDVKAPGSGMQRHNDLENLARLRARDELKLVLLDRADYEWAREFVRSRGLESRVAVHFSPVHGKLEPAELAAWILEDGLRVRLNLQLHKYVWGPDARGV